MSLLPFHVKPLPYDNFTDDKQPQNTEREHLKPKVCGAKNVNFWDTEIMSYTFISAHLIVLILRFFYFFLKLFSPLSPLSDMSSPCKTHPFTTVQWLNTDFKML